MRLVLIEVLVLIIGMTHEEAEGYLSSDKEKVDIVKEYVVIVKGFNIIES
jgi:hypothetical protein